MQTARTKRQFRELTRSLANSSLARQGMDGRRLPAAKIMHVVARQQRRDTAAGFMILGIFLLYIVSMLLYAFVIDPFESDFYTYIPFLKDWIAERSLQFPVLLVANLVFLIPVVLVIRLSMRQHLDERLLKAIVYLAVEFDRWKRDGPTSIRLQSDILSALDMCASRAQELPRLFILIGDDRTRDELNIRAVGIAKQFREYKIWITMPIETTKRDLGERIARSMYLVHARKWYELDALAVTINQRVNLLHRIGWIAVFLVLAGGLVYLVIKQPELGGTATVLTSLLSLGIVIVLAKLGVTISSLQQASEASAALESKLKAGGSEKL